MLSSSNGLFLSLNYMSIALNILFLIGGLWVMTSSTTLHAAFATDTNKIIDFLEEDALLWLYPLGGNIIALGIALGNLTSYKKKDYQRAKIFSILFIVCAPLSGTITTLLLYYNKDLRSYFNQNNNAA